MLKKNSRHLNIASWNSFAVRSYHSGEKQQQWWSVNRSFEKTSGNVTSSVLSCIVRGFFNVVLHGRKVPHILCSWVVLFLGSTDHSEHNHRSEEPAAQVLHQWYESIATCGAAVRVRCAEQLFEGNPCRCSDGRMVVPATCAVGRGTGGYLTLPIEVRNSIYDSSTISATQV